MKNIYEGCYIRQYCSLCEVEHDVSKTIDQRGNAVGLWCPIQKRQFIIFHYKWNGTDVRRLLLPFLMSEVNPKSLRKLNNAKVESLARKLAYMFLQTPEGKQLKASWYWLTMVVALELDELKASALTGSF